MDQPGGDGFEQQPTTSSFDLQDALEEQTPPEQEVIQPRIPRRAAKFRRGRNFCWTLNNPTTLEIRFWKKLLRNGDFRRKHKVRYLSFQAEHPTGGQFHFQGYVELSLQCSPSWIKRNFGSRIHFENRLGTQAQAIAYTKKRDTRVDGLAGDGGEAKKLGKDKLAVVAAELKSGSTLAELREDYPVSFIRDGPKIRSFALDLIGPRSEPPEVIIYYGPTGTGKSATARKNWPDNYWVPRPRPGGWWWPRYSGEETIIIDEFASQFKYHTMLNLLDRYPFDLQEKCGNMTLAASTKRIVFTTNIHPNQWYKNIPYRAKKPLRRRFRDFAKIYVFADDSTWDNPKMTLETSGPCVLLSDEDN